MTERLERLQRERAETEKFAAYLTRLERLAEFGPNPFWTALYNLYFEARRLTA